MAIETTCRRYIFPTIKAVFTFTNEKSSLQLILIQTTSRLYSVTLLPTTSRLYRVRIKLFLISSKINLDDPFQMTCRLDRVCYTDDIFDFYRWTYTDDFLQTTCRLYRLQRRQVVWTELKIDVYIVYDPFSVLGLQLQCFKCKNNQTIQLIRAHAT